MCVCVCVCVCVGVFMHNEPTGLEGESEENRKKGEEEVFLLLYTEAKFALQWFNGLQGNHFPCVCISFIIMIMIIITIIIIWNVF